MWKVVKGLFAENQVRNVPQITLVAFPAFRSRKIPHFCGSQNYRLLALHNRCATDAYQHQASHGPLKNENNEKMVYWI